MSSYVFDFTDPTSHVREKEIKRQTLLELGDYVNQDNTAKFTDKVFDDVMYMLLKKILFDILSTSEARNKLETLLENISIPKKKNQS